MTHEFMASNKRICNVDVDVFLFREVEFFPLRKTGKTGNNVFLDLFNDLMVFFSFYRSKSPSKHHLGEYVLLFSKHLKQIQVFFGSTRKSGK